MTANMADATAIEMQRPGRRIGQNAFQVAGYILPTVPRYGRLVPRLCDVANQVMPAISTATMTE